MQADLTFGQIVRERRLIRDLTQVELARRVGCATVTIRKIEYDTLRPSVQIAERLAMALHIPLEERAKFIRLGRSVLQDTPEPSPLPTPPPAADEIGQEDLSGRAVRGYELGERIGHGGFGVVYRAMQPIVERQVAIKIILPKYANHPDFIRRFEAEAQIIARIEHPFIVPLYDYWREPDAAYLIMRLLRGGSLKALLKEGALDLERVTRHLEQIGTALHAAHRAGIIHRDINPANILLDEDENTYLADFGIAKNLGNPNLSEQTATGAMIGSPAYISPEQIKAEPVRPQADIYCLGLLLYEMLTGRKAFPGPTSVAYIQQHLNDPLPPLAEAGPAHSLPVALDTIIARATAKDPHSRYPDVLDFLEDIQTAVSTQGSLPITPVSPLSTKELAELENPYKGLRPFGIGDSNHFFGRDAMVQELLSRLADADDPPGAGSQRLDRFLAIVGPSGSGKSSVVKAGLIPALRQGGVPGSENWFIVDMMPGSHPLEELEAALLRVAVNPPDSLLAQLGADERGLIRAVKRILPADRGTDLLLIIDQFEEIFTLVADEEDRVHFLESLVTAVVDPRSRIRIVITLRADFTDRPLRYVDFGELVHRRTEFILPLSPDELEQVITKPARQSGLIVEPELVVTMIHDVADQPGALPLLQYTLTELFECKDGRVLTLEAYHDIGGISGALARRADDIYEGLDEAGQIATQQLFLRLVTLGEGNEDTRRRVKLSELESLAINRDADSARESEKMAHELPIAEYGRYRLLTFDHDPLTREPTVEVAHEALLREWARLRLWLEESRNDIRRQRLLATAAAQWADAGEEASYLLRGNRLVEFAAWAETTQGQPISVALTEQESRFLEASIVARGRRLAEEQARQQRELETARELAEIERKRAEEQTRSAQRLRQRALFLAGALVVAALLAVIAVFNGNRAVQNADEARDNLALAVSREAEAVANANAAATQEALAKENANLAGTREAEAQRNANAAATSQAEAVAQEAVASSQRATAEAAAAQRAVAQAEAEEEARVAFSRELAAAALNNLQVDPERSILLALEAIHTAETVEARNALHAALPALQLIDVLSDDEKRLYEIVANEAGTLLAEATVEDDEVRIWDIRSGQIIKEMADEEIKFGHLAFIPGTNLLAVSNSQYVMQIWDLDSDTVVQTIDVGQDLAIYEPAFSPDGTHLTTWGPEGGEVVIWDIASGERMLTISGHSDVLLPEFGRSGVMDIKYSPDGNYLATADSDGTIKLWDARNGRRLAELEGHQSAVLYLAFSPDGRRLASASLDGTAKIWELQSNGQGGEVILTLNHEQFPASIAYSPDGTRLATGNAEGPIFIWDAVTGRKQLSLYGHNDLVYDLYFNDDGTRLFSGSSDGDIRVWSLAPQGEILTVAVPSGLPIELDYTADESHLVTLNSEGHVRTWDADSGEPLSTVTGFPQNIWTKDLSPNLAYLTVITRTVVEGIGTPATPWVWDTASGEKLFYLPGEVGEIEETLFSPDSSRLLSYHADGSVKIWDISGSVAAGVGQELLAIQAEDVFLYTGTFSPAGDRLAFTDPAAGKITLWDGQSGTGLFSWMTLSPGYNQLRFSPDGTKLAGVSRFGAITVWDLDAGRETELFTVVGHGGAIVNDIAYSPDGNYLATCSINGTNSVWDAYTGELVTSLPGHDGQCVENVFSSDGRHLASAGWDGLIRIYTLELAELLSLAQSRVTRSLTEAECRQYLHLDACPERP